jgi:hypothetical protein
LTLDRKRALAGASALLDTSLALLASPAASALAAWSARLI